jgi:hypothetical protein
MRRVGGGARQRLPGALAGIKQLEPCAVAAGGFVAYTLTRKSLGLNSSLSKIEADLRLIDRKMACG